MGDSDLAGAASPPPVAATLADDLRSNLLHTITASGGAAFAATFSLAAAGAGDLAAAEASREMAWEQLHSGPWHEVLPAWRDAYALACLQVAKLGEPREALRALDMGLIMGGNLLRRDLEAAIERIGKGEGGGDDHRWKKKLSEAVGVLPRRSLSCELVEKICELSLESFVCNYFLKELPIVISGCIDHWPARTRWKDIGYLKRIAGVRTVPVEVGKNYLSPEWNQELITFSEFLERICSSDSPANLTYLAQHPLFDQIQELRQDIMVPDYCFAGGGELQSLNAWFGPPGTVTPLHHDPHHNLFAQAVGRKYIRLYPASVSEDLYPHSETMLCNSSQVVGRKYIRLYPASVSEDLYPHSETMLCNSSQVDLDNPNTEEYPKAECLDFMDCVLEEGEMLYIPPKWWHYVRSLSTSFSVSFWWSAAGFPHEST